MRGNETVDFCHVADPVADPVAVGLRELRQDASELIRRVEGGEEIDVTVSARRAVGSRVTSTMACVG